MRGTILNTSIFLLFLVGLSCSNDDTAKQVENLLGTWKLIGYAEGDADVIVDFLNGDETVMINFEENNFSGETGRNQFFGSYSVESNKLTLNMLNTTEIAESDWGRKFMESLVQSYDEVDQDYKLTYVIKTDTLIIQYELGEYMHLKKD
ncbi:META domain-containing protein [Maribacter sp. ACAM166]|uniref:META domain-containing protein n=1 Tax=Maribacter sp. ACAM166 TaxID=2508996 RepID=UPI0010FDDD89|nr:META domain-containing protein [Maribacter sp. ACAM166]TLP79282.1 META domain-containing protein [Maribacter sp. ACAM166]